jgi:hypothetical protein
VIIVLAICIAVCITFGVCRTLQLWAMAMQPLCWAVWYTLKSAVAFPFYVLGAIFTELFDNK